MPSGSEFAASMAFVLEREGGFVNDAADRGGATKYGITAATLTRARGVASVTPADVQQLRISEAVAIYERDYWRASAADRIALERPCLALCHFDAAVNHGVQQATRFLQRALGVDADGIAGSMTMRAVATCVEDATIAAYLRQRAAFFRALVERAPSQRKFLKGWLARCRWVARECGIPIDTSYSS